MASAAEQLAANMNFAAFSKADELKKRIWFTLGALLVYRLGTYIPLPGIDPAALAQVFQAQQGGIFDVLDLFSGGAVGRMAIFALTIMPYISASIIIQLMTSVSSHLGDLKKEGEQGRKTINQYTRYGTVILATLQGYAIASGLSSAEGVVTNPGMYFTISAVITLVGGASVTFNRAFASFGLDKQAIRLGTLIEENTLAGIGAENSADVYSTAGYFDAIDTPAATAFKTAYVERFGADAPVLNTLGEGCYEAVMALRAMFSAAGSTDTTAVAAAAEGVSYSSPRGTTTLSQGFAASDIYLAKADGNAFKIVQNFSKVAAGNACKNG